LYQAFVGFGEDTEHIYILPAAYPSKAPPAQQSRLTYLQPDKQTKYPASILRESHRVDPKK
jgi:hypothetical protein